MADKKPGGGSLPPQKGTMEKTAPQSGAGTAPASGAKSVPNKKK